MVNWIGVRVRILFVVGFFIIFLFENNFGNSSEIISEQIPIETMSREEVLDFYSSNKFDEEIQGEFFGIYTDYGNGTPGYQSLAVLRCSNLCSQKIFNIKPLNYPSDSIIKVKGIFQRDDKSYGFSVEASEKLSIAEKIATSCQDALISNRKRLSEIDYTRLLDTEIEIFFTQDDIIAAGHSYYFGGIDYEGQYIHLVYKGPEVWEGIAVHSPFVKCIYHLETDTVEKLVAYIYGHTEE